ncbi:hypothetical protein SCHPADRAFT_229625 [Schizopora paradoxa]|uniref:Helitron helicase-like domain-containing protein n=1 Tax=Schizopora paradoxa TaxID=27342 RepID=A0A0H2RVP4_9AGAM|nr:hypothetical protein SCHPADRAFT_229625 [Schizopora paradoxa]
MYPTNPRHFVMYLSVSPLPDVLQSSLPLTMPLQREQEAERGRRRRREQDDNFRERERLRAAERRRAARQHHVERQRSEVPLQWWDAFKGALRNYRWPVPTWNRNCGRCGAQLMRGERTEFCCASGKHLIPPLPPLPTGLARLADNPRIADALSSKSRSLNYLFNFTAIGVTGGYTHFKQHPSSVSMTGRTYHRMLDATTPDHSIHWFLYDEQHRNSRATEYEVPSHWVQAVRQDLQRVNPYVHHLRNFSNVPGDSSVALELQDHTATGEFAAILHTANTVDLQPRKILIWRNSKEQPTFIPITSRHYEPLQYPVLFPHGSPGWGLPSTYTGPSNNEDEVRNRLGHTLLQWVKGRVLTDARFLTFGRLTSEYLCDMYSRIEEQRLLYIRRNRDRLAHERDPDFPEHDPVPIDLPSSFMGSRRWASMQTADGLALARKYGRASFFITFTCNPEWPEITSRLRPGQSAADAPVIVARAFKLRLQAFMTVLRAKLGLLKYMIKVIEFQKRGLPHAHLIIKVTSRSS